MFRYATLLILFLHLNLGAQEFHEGNIDLRLGGRFYVVSFLEEIFGKDNISNSPEGYYRKSGELYPLTVEFFISKRDLLGGPCDIYDMSENDSGELEFPSRHCHLNSSSINTPMVVGPSVVRDGFRIRGCEEIMNINASIDHALEKASVISGDGDVREDLIKIYSLFFPSRPHGGESFNAVIDSLNNVYGSLESPYEGWRHVLLTLCYDPSWQII